MIELRLLGSVSLEAVEDEQSASPSSRPNDALGG